MSGLQRMPFPDAQKAQRRAKPARIRVVTASHVAEFDVPRAGPTARITLGHPTEGLEIPMDMLDGATVFTDDAAIEERRRGCVQAWVPPEPPKEEKRR